MMALASLSTQPAKVPAGIAVKWLAILNTHTLLKPTLYKMVFETLQERDSFTHGFDKIFLVHEEVVVDL
jgi:hypothetical protein